MCLSNTFGSPLVSMLCYPVITHTVIESRAVPYKMKSQGKFSQQSEGSPHLLQLNALICLLWRLKVLGLVRQENKCCNFHQQSGCSDTELTPKSVEELHSDSFPGCGLPMGLVLPSLPTALSLCNRNLRLLLAATERKLKKFHFP